MRAVAINIVFLFCLMLAFSSCKKKVQLPSNKIEKKDSTKIDMIKLNALIADVEAEQIEAFIDSSEIDWQYDSLGYWYKIIRKGSGAAIAKDAVVYLNYEVNTLQGDSCYSYKGDKHRTIVVGRSRYERGLNYGLQKMNEGDSALFVVPSQLSFGLMGDRKVIPPRATLVYSISSVQLK